MTNETERRRYDGVAMSLHWILAIMIVAIGALGLSFDLVSRPTRSALINLHVCIGLVAIGLIAMRVLWRMTHRAPPYPPEWPRASVRLAHLGHLALYALLIVTPLVGFAARVWHGRGFDFGFAQVDFGVASNRAVYGPAENVHELLAYALMAFLALHVAAALFHRFVLRDDTLARMWPGRAIKS